MLSDVQLVIDSQNKNKNKNNQKIKKSGEQQHFNIDYNFDHQMSLSKSKCLYLNNCLQFLKCALPFCVASPKVEKVSRL
jgi:hypothetical protein